MPGTGAILCPARFGFTLGFCILLAGSLVEWQVPFEKESGG
jgi:hypothetical protein